MATKPGRTSKKPISAKERRVVRSAASSADLPSVSRKLAAAADQSSKVAGKTPKKPARPPKKKEADPVPKPKLKFPPFQPFPIGERIKALRGSGAGRSGARTKPKT